MARYQHLRVFKDFYDLAINILSAIRSFPRIFKFTLGNEIQKNVFNIMEFIIYANSLRDKKSVLTKTIIQAESLQVRLRITKDLQCFSNINVYLQFSEDLNKIIKQLEKWKQSSL